jgi:L,D-transpeptidase catalytic domain
MRHDAPVPAVGTDRSYGFGERVPMPGEASSPGRARDTRTCVNLAAKHAWFIEDGTVVRGPVPISRGAPGHETPTGEFRVEWKNTNHRSAEHGGAPMPFAVFFAERTLRSTKGASTARRRVACASAMRTRSSSTTS